MTKRNELLAEVIHGTFGSEGEAIIINIGSKWGELGLCVAYPLKHITTDTIKAYHYKLMELQMYGYKIRFK